MGLATVQACRGRRLDQLAVDRGGPRASGSHQESDEQRAMRIETFWAPKIVCARDRVRAHISNDCWEYGHGIAIRVCELQSSFIGGRRTAVLLTSVKPFEVQAEGILIQRVLGKPCPRPHPRRAGYGALPTALQPCPTLFGIALAAER